jgi:hypothetical protein
MNDDDDDDDSFMLKQAPHLKGKVMIVQYVLNIYSLTLEFC